MADPLSLAASAAGLLSLGIQVTQGISKYLDALKGRREDLDAVRRKNDALGHILDSVKSTVSSPQPLNRPHAAVADCIATCEGELAGLETLVAQLAGCKDVQTWKTRLQNQSKKLSYPFKQSKIQQLSQRLDQANVTLQIALEGLGLHIAQRSQQTLDGVATSIHDFSGEFRFVRSEVASILQYSEESKTLQRDHYGRVENHLAMYTTSLSTIVSTTQNHNTALIAQNSELIAEIGNLRKLIATQERGSTSRHPSRVTPAQAVFRIARSPPSQLRKLCDDLGGPDSINLVANGNSSSLCLCTAHGRKDKRNSTHWGFLQLYHERSDNAHQPHCPWAKKTKKFGLGLFGLTKVLQVAIDVSFTLSSGAGGWSLSQNFTYYPTVDDATDPVFLAMGTFLRSRNKNNRIYGPEAEEGRVMELLQEIKQAYAEGRSTPTAVDLWNNTLLHLFFDYEYDAFGIRSWETVYKTLRSLGVPTTSHNLYGRTWLSDLPSATFDLNRNHQSTLALSTIVQSDFAGIPANLEAPLNVTVSSFLRVLDMSPVLGEAYGCGPMSLAVLANDSEEVERLLASHPESLFEQNSAGQTPLHLAANKPSCLELLVRASTGSLLNQRDGEGTSPLEYAMWMSSERCSSYDDRKCSRCHCTECVAILLNADCEVSFDNESHYEMFFEDASERARHLFVSHLTNRRQRLLQLAKSNRPIISKSGLSLQIDELPDTSAPLIIDLLRANGVIISPALDISTSRDMFKPMFHILNDPHSAKMFFRSGFRDIDSLYNNQRPLTVDRRWDLDLEYLVWLVDNGADISRLLVPSRQIPDSADIRGIFAIHSVFYQIGRWVPSRLHWWSDEDFWANVSNFISRLLSLSVQDSCMCACSNESCTPLVYLLKGIRSEQYAYHSLRRSNILEHKAELIVRNFEPLDDTLDVQLQLSSIRWITFEALELTHSCCNPKEVLASENSPPGTETDDLSLEGEDPEVLEMFEQMVEELQETAQNTYAATSSLVHFWTKIWASRVGKERDKLMGTNLDEKERADSEAIGVKWHHHPQPEERSFCVATGNPYRWGTWESVEWKDRQLDPAQYEFRMPMKPRTSAFQSFEEDMSEGSSRTTESHES